MSLNGNLEIFPVEEVLRLLARSHKTGCLRVESAGHQGRVFIAGGSLTFATTSTDEEIRRQIINAGLVGPDDFRKVDLSGVSLSEVLAPTVTSSDLTDFVREQIVESLYRVRKAGKGKFDFLVDVAARYPTGQAFDVEFVIAESERRSTEWADIDAVIPDLHAKYRLARTLTGDDAVTISSSTWRFLAAVESGANADELADRLGLSTFVASRELATLVRNGLMESAIQSAAPTHYESSTPSAPRETMWTEDPTAAGWAAETPAPRGWETESPAPAAAGWESEIPAPAAAGWEAEAPAPSGWETEAPAPSGWESEIPAPAAAGWESEIPAPAAAGWEAETPVPSGWEAETPVPTADSLPAAEPDVHNTSWFAQATAAKEAEDAEVDSDQGWWSTDEKSEGDDRQADEFLESVFSQLNEGSAEETPVAEDESNFGLGLLRRRRMGAAARDITGN